jgi:hypothetical protein
MNKNTKQNTKTKKTKNQKNKLVKFPKTHPPPFTSQSVRNFRLRCVSTASNSGTSLAYNQLAGLLGVIATGITTSVYLSSVFRFKRMVIWGPVQNAGTPVTVSITWFETNADFESPPKTMTDTSVSFDWPAYVNFKAPKGSLIDKWHGSGQSDQALVFSAPEGSTVDFEFEWVLSDGNVASVVGPTLVGATAGLVLHKITASLDPVGVTAL